VPDPDLSLPDDLVVAVDGPSGSGKSSAAQGVARALGLRYLDTGATYRALTWWVLEHGIDPTDAQAVGAAGRQAAIRVGTDPDVPSVLVDGHDVARAIRGPEVTTAVSPVSAVPEVRTQLVALQRELIGPGGIVVEGRDIGTVVAPDAAVKVFLTASSSARAQRRTAELKASSLGAGVSTDATMRDLERRDRYDSSRATAPLLAAHDAVELDATDLSLDEVIDQIVDLVRARVGRAHS
jgi:cytidylate kinase